LNYYEDLAEERGRVLERGGEAFHEDRLTEVDSLRSQAAFLKGLLGNIAATQQEWLAGSTVRRQLHSSLITKYRSDRSV
jgi:hypothetical protein